MASAEKFTIFVNEKNTSLINDSTIHFGDFVDCEKLDSLLTTQLTKKKTLLVPKYFNVETYCTELEIEQKFIVSDESVHSFYSQVSTLGNGAYGNVHTIYSGKFKLALISLNGLFSDSIAWLQMVLNSNQLYPTLYVLLINDLKTSVAYNKLLLGKILETRQIIHIITATDFDERFQFVSVSTVKNNTNLELYSDGLFINVTVGDKKQTFMFNYGEALDCDFPLCYDSSVCSNARSNDYCINFESDLKSTLKSKIVRHNEFEIESYCSKRNKREAEPSWFISWLHRNGFLSIDTTFVDEKSSNTIYYQMLNPKYGFYHKDGTYINADCSESTKPSIIANDGRFRFTMSLNGKNVTILQYVNCYHGIVFDESKKCKIFNVSKINETTIAPTTTTTSTTTTTTTPTTTTPKTTSTTNRTT